MVKKRKKQQADCQTAASYDPQKTGVFKLAGIPTVYVIPKSVRLPEQSHGIYTYLLEEALSTGVGKMSTLARAIILARLAEGNLDPIRKIIAEAIPVTTYDPRITIRFSEKQIKENITPALEAIPEGNFSSLTWAILIDRYEKR
jgi:hypothetical protein